MKRLLMLLSMLSLASCFQPQTIRFFGDQDGTDTKTSLRDGIARFIIHQGFGHNIVYVFGSTAQIKQMMAENQVDVIPQADGTFLVRDDLKKVVPDVVDTLKKMKLDDPSIEDCLAWQAENADSEESDVVLYYIYNKQSTWMTWVPTGVYHSTQSVMRQKRSASKFKETL